MRHRLRNTFAVLSLLFCGASIALWVRSYRTADILSAGRFAAWSELGAVYLSHDDEGGGIRREEFRAGHLGVWEIEWGTRCGAGSRSG